MKYMNLLGLLVKDVVTNFEGVVTSISYDLYGCIQAIVVPQEKDSGKGFEEKSRWYDVSRLVVLDETPLMERPDFEVSPEKIADGGKGPEVKPIS